MTGNQITIHDERFYEDQLRILWVKYHIKPVVPKEDIESEGENKS
jgi:hypothetical protein